MPNSHVGGLLIELHKAVATLRINLNQTGALETPPTSLVPPMSLVPLARRLVGTTKRIKAKAEARNPKAKERARKIEAKEAASPEDLLQIDPDLHPLAPLTLVDPTKAKGSVTCASPS